MKQKMAIYIDKNCNLNQEFHFAHPATKVRVNNIYNCHFSGSQVWDLFSPGAASFEGTYNRSIKVMNDLPYGTHRNLVGHLAGGHMRMKLIRNYLGFIKRVRESPKYVLRQLYDLASCDVRTVTGSNLRNILMLTNQLQVGDLDPSVVDNIQYNTIEENEMWKIGLVKELIEMKHGNIQQPEGWSEDDLEDVLNLICTQ